MAEVVQRNEYDDEPVFYCRSCHSLNIVVDDSLSDKDWDGAYCADCHSCDIGTCDIEEWIAEDERMRRQKEEREWKR